MAHLQFTDVQDRPTELGSVQYTCICHAWHIHVRTKPLADSLVQNPSRTSCDVPSLSRHPTLPRSP